MNATITSATNAKALARLIGSVDGYVTGVTEQEGGQTLTKLFEGFIEMNAGQGILPFELWDDGGFTYAYVDGDMADDLPGEDREEFREYLDSNYGTKFYRLLPDYKRDAFLTIDQIWEHP